MNKEIVTLISQIARIRNVDITYVSETLKLSIIAGLKRRFGADTRAEVDINPEAGDLNVFVIKTVAAEVQNESLEISLADARKLKPDVKTGDELRVEIPPAEIGRIAIRKASEELMLKLREAERTKLYDEYLKKRGEIVTGTIQKIGRDEIIVNLGLVEASLSSQEQLKTDHYRQGAPIKALVHRVEKAAVGPRILLSRTHPDFLRRLLAKEIPEIRQGVVEIRAVARAPSFRSKVAVYCADERIDPVGACVGYRKSRIENVIKELSGEKVDIVQWSKDTQVFISRALGPAKVKQVIQEDEAYIVIVPDSEFSIAIGKKGQNVWLASLLVGTKLEVLKETDFENRAVMHKASRVSVVDLGLGPELTTRLQDQQVLTAFDLLSIPAKDLADSVDLPVEQIEQLKQQVGVRFREPEKAGTEGELAHPAEASAEALSVKPAPETVSEAAAEKAPETEPAAQAKPKRSRKRAAPPETGEPSEGEAPPADAPRDGTEPPEAQQEPESGSTDTEPVAE
jgi:N utilization substance protein A